MTEVAVIVLVFRRPHLPCALRELRLFGRFGRTVSLRVTRIPLPKLPTWVVVRVSVCVFAARFRFAARFGALLPTIHLVHARRVIGLVHMKDASPFRVDAARQGGRCPRALSP